MEDSWQMKRLPPWGLPESISPAPQPLAPVLSPPPPIAPVAQVDANRCTKFHSFIPWESNLGANSIVQDPTGLHSLNSIRCASRRAEMGNTFLNFLPGPLPRQNSYTPRGFRAGSVSGDTKGSTVFSPCLMAPSENYVNERSEKKFSADKRCSSVSSSSFSSGIEIPMLNVFSHEKNEAEPRNGMPLRSPSFTRGCPRVFCLGKVGELFVSDDGLLGVYCLCHYLRMSVAKFCEHSGLYAVNPGNAVILENGETVAQWRRLFFLNLGVNVPDDGSGWDWTNVASAAGFFNRSKVDTLSSSKNYITFQPYEEVGRPDVFPNIRQSQYPVEECSTWQKSQRNFENTKKRDDMNSTQCVPSWLVNGPMPNQVKEYEQQLAYSMSDFTYTTGWQNCGRRMMSDCAVSEKTSPSNPNCDLKKPFLGDSNDNRDGSSGVHPFANWDSTLSNVELRLGQPSQHGFTMPTALCPQQKNHSINSEYFKCKQEKHSMKTTCVPPEFSASTEGVWHQMQNPGKRYEQQADDLEEDCNPVIPFMSSHISVAEGELKSRPVKKVIGKNRNLGFSNLSTNVSGGNKIGSYQRGKGLFVSSDDDSFVMKQCTLFEKKSDKEHRAPDEPTNFLSNEKNSLYCQKNHNSYHLSANRAFEDSDGWKELDSRSRTAKASFISTSPKNSFFSSNTMTASNPMSSSSKSISHVKTEQPKDNAPNLAHCQKMNIKKLPIYQSMMEMTRNMSDDVLDISDDYIHKKSSVACRYPHSRCEYGSSDLASSLYIETDLTDSVQDDSLCSSETRARSPFSHAYNNIMSTSRLCISESQVTERGDNRFFSQIDERLVHSKHLKEQITEQIIDSKVCSKGQNPFPTSYYLNNLTPASRDTMLGQCDDSLPRYDKNVFADRFLTSDPITAGSTSNRLTCARDNVQDGYYHETFSSNEERLYNTYPGYSAHLVADLSVEDNNLDINIVLDEGSVVEKCGSSDDVHENGERIKYGSCSSLRFNARDENGICQSGVTLHKKSIRGEKGCYIRPESTCKTISASVMKKKKKKAPKWRKLDGSFPSSGEVDMIRPIRDIKMKNSSDVTEFSANLRTQKKTLGLKNRCDSSHSNHENCKMVKNLVAERKKKRYFRPDDTEEMEEYDTNLKQTGVLPFDGIRHKDRLMKPVVHGPYGIICSNILHGKSKPVKIVSLSSLLKRCPITQNAEKNDGLEKTEMKFETKSNSNTKETRRRKLSDMMGNLKEEVCTSNIPFIGRNHSVNNSQLPSAGRVADDSVDEHQPQKKNQKRLASDDCYVNTDYQCRQKPSKYRPSCSITFAEGEYDSDAFCCVCRSSKKEDDNSLLECSNCSIKVHQACYGVAKIPKGRWSCRPCRRNSKDTVGD